MATPSGVTLGELRSAGKKLVRAAGKQVLLIAQGGRVFAIANRCPHEGYPLSEGTIDGECRLTCNWHNWKFDLKSGAALVGRDPVRTYKVEMRGDAIFLDLSDPPREELRTRALSGLDAAIADNDGSRIARETARLERAGYDASLAFAHAIAARNERLEDGMTHAHAAGADWLALASRAPDDAARLTAMLEPVGHLAEDTLGAGRFPYTDDVAEWDAEAFVAAIEREDEAAAVARLRGAMAADMPYEILRPAFARAALAHYADFGHCAIYAFKAGQLIARLGDAVREPVLLALTRMIVRSTREERIPEFRFYDKALTAWDGGGTARVNADDFIGQSVDGALKRALGSSARSAREMFDALLGAVAFNLLHFDLAVQEATDNAVADNVGWLDFTHALTFANACRHLCAEAPELWPRALLQMALFVGRNRKYVRDVGDGARWALRDRDAFLNAEIAGLYDHGIPEPIVACHRVKVLLALEDELAAAPEAPWAEAMCAGVNRYLHIPMKRHHGLRTAAQALDFIAKEG